MIANQALHFAFLLESQQPSRSLGTMTMLNDHRRPTAAFISLGGGPHGAFANLAKLGCLGYRSATKTHLDRASATLVQHCFA